MLNKKRYESKVEVFIFVSILVLSLTISFVSAERLPTVGGDTDNWGTILNEYLSEALGDNATTLNISGDATFNTDVIISGTLYGVSPVKIAGGINLTTGNMSIGGIQVWEREGCLATRHFSTIGENGESGYIKIANGTSPPHNESGAGLIWVQNEKLYFQQSDRTNIEITNQTGNYLNLSGTNANQDINISPYNFVTENLTLSDKITFAFGEIIDNIVDGWVRITGNLNMGVNNITNVSYIELGEEDTRTGTVIIYGDNAIAGGKVSIYNPASLDTTINAWTIDAFNELRFKADDTPFMSLSGVEGATAALSIGMNDNDGGTFTAMGDSTTAGGKLDLYNSAGEDTIVNYWRIEANDRLEFLSDATQRMVIANDGNVGINTTDPQNTLNVIGTLNITNATGTLGLYQNSSGNVGIGTSSPAELLHLFGNNAAVILTDDSGNYARIKVGNSQLTLEADPDDVIASTDMVFKMDGDEVARFYQGGNFGIGTITTGGDGQLSLGESSEEGCFRYNSVTDGLEFSHQCDNNFSLISDAGFYGSLWWEPEPDCAMGTGGGFTTPTAFSPDADCDDKVRIAMGLTTSNLAIGNAEGRKPQIKFDSLPAGYYSVILHGNFRADPADVDCSYMMSIDSGAINSSLSGMTAGAGVAGMSPVVSGLLYVPTDRGASTIELYGGESAANCRIQITSTELEITVYYYPQYNSTTGADYAEWFEKEDELILAGDLIGLNVETGKVRVWRYADPIIGIASNNPSVTGNYKIGIEKTHALVGLVGQLNLNDPRIKIKNNLVYSSDGQFIGYRVADGKVFLNREDGRAIQEQQSEIQLLKSELCSKDSSYSWC